ncbi:MAG: DEAD/DEAH box helicase [Flavobacteriales bacterium]|nr:DEAD/DEAH box helicase [Flavobacteriales bacterium]
MKFDDYDIAPGIKRSLEKLGFKKPTDIQFRSIPPILKGEDVLAIAQTGTGKTAAFAIPVISTIEFRKRPDRPDGVKCIVMAPTHELAEQIAGVFTELARHTRVTVLCIHGGVDQEPQIAGLNNGVDVLIATPGRLFDLVSQGHLRLHRVEILVLDEADHMLDLGFIKDIRDLTNKLTNKRQTLFFSATINEHIKDLAYSLVRNPIRIQVSPKDPVSKNITHSVAFIGMDDKRYFLERVVNENPESKILVFVRTKVRAERVLKAMERVDIRCVTIHSDKDAAERNAAMAQFRSGEVKILVATDVSARGIDIPDVDFVVNYDLPDKPENYVHRVGRTGRGMKKGLAVSFCSDEEKEVLGDIEEYLTKPINRVEMDRSDYAQTIDFSREHDWKTLMAKEEEFQSKKKKKKGK